MTYYRVTDPASNVISDFVGLNFTGGKQSLQDTISASTGSFTFRRTTSNSTQLDALIPGDNLTLEYSNTGSTWSSLLDQYITDITVEWGNPAPGPVYNDDYVTITTEGALASWGRYQANTTVSNGTAESQLNTLASGTGLSYTENISTYSNDILLGYTATGSLQDYLQLLATTLNCRFNDFINAANVDILSAYNFPTSTYNFTDQPASGNLLSCESIAFDSLAMNYYNEVILSLGDGPIPVVALDTGASTPYRVLALPTNWQNSGSALGYAQYLLDLYKAPTQEISSVTCLSEAQGNSRLAEIARTCIGKKFSIAFRGSTLYGICEGFTMTASPGNSTFTFYFSSAAQDIAWLILDSSTQGKLDVNKLGF